MSEPQSRLRTVDGLRGLAALAVVVFHLYGATQRSYGDWAPSWIGATLKQGFFGVEVFFVLSGFVIAYSVRHASYTAGFLGRFALRRLIRLDPPYWAAILLEIGLIWLSLHVAAQTTSTIPSLSQTLLHVVYLQNLTGHGDIVPVFWTLCYEVQFYLFLIGLLVLGRSLRLRGVRVDRWAGVGLGLLFIVSVFGRYHVLPIDPPGVALTRWFQFFLGVMVWWVVSGITRPSYLLAAWAVVAGSVIGTGYTPLQLVPVAVSALLWWSYRRDSMASLLSARPWQFLGAISYSLYLFHVSVGWRLVRAPEMLGLHPSRLGVLGTYLGAIGFTIVFSWVAWRLWERPFQRLSHRLGRARLGADRPMIVPLIVPGMLPLSHEIAEAVAEPIERHGPPA